MLVHLRIKELMQERGLSQGKFSRGADIPPNLVRRMLKDPTYIPSLLTLLKASRFLGVSVEALYYVDEDGESPNQQGSGPPQ